MTTPREEPTLTQTDASDVDSLLDSVLVEPAATNLEPSSEEPPAIDPEPKDSALSETPSVVESTPTLVEPAPPEVMPDPEVEAVQEPKNMSPSNRQHWRKLDGLARERLKKLREFETQLQEVKAKSATPQPVPEELQRELEDHRSFRKMFDIQNDREFTEKYDSAMTKNRETAYAIFAKHGMPADQLEALKVQGFESIGPVEFEDGIIKTLMTGEGASLETRKDAMALKKLMETNLSLMFERENVVKEAAKQGSVWQQQRQAAAEAHVKNFDSVVEQRVRAVQEKVSWAKLQEIPAAAAPEVRARIERDNKFYKEYVEPRFREAMYSQAPEVRVDTAMAAVLAYKYSDELDAANTANKQLRDELAAIRSAGKTRAQAPLTPLAKKTPSINDALGMSDSAAIDAGLDAALNRSGA